MLVRISDAIAYIAPEDVPIAIKKLAERFAVESEVAVRAKIFWVFAELGEVTPDTLEKAKIVNETAELLRNEESHRVKSQGLATLLKLGDYQRCIYLMCCCISSFSSFIFQDLVLVYICSWNFKIFALIKEIKNAFLY